MSRAAASTLRALQIRDALFAPGMFRDPRWYMLVDLYHAESIGRSVSVSDLCIASGGPPTTALRHICAMERDGWLRRSGDRRDERRSWMYLTDRARDQLDDYFDRIDPAARVKRIAGSKLVDDVLALLRPALMTLAEARHD